MDDLKIKGWRNWAILSVVVAVGLAVDYWLALAGHATSLMLWRDILRVIPYE